MSETIQQTDIVLNDCWNHIGVWGNESPRCEKLNTHIHCRNCEIYSNAGRKILERRLPDEYESSWADVYAKEKVPLSTGTESITIFRLGNEWLALPTKIIREITEIQNIHSIPHRENPVLRGLVNLRGQLRICVSLGQLLGIDKADTITPVDATRIYNRMMNINNGTDDFVFVVSEVKDTYRIELSMLNPAPATIQKAHNTFSLGMLNWNGHNVACLDSELLFYNLVSNVS